MKVKFLTLGCKVNQHETQGLREKFRQFGFSETQRKADLYVINTCTVTHRADSKSRQIIKQVKKENPLARIAVCGCLAQLNREAIAEIGADYIVSQDEKHLLPEIVSGNLSDKNTGVRNKDIWSLKITHFNHQRVFVKIQDGCDNFCSFCKIPYLRGPSVSRPYRDIIEEINKVSVRHKECVLCGINLSLYGRNLDPPRRLEDLIEDILKTPALNRLRLSSLEPYGLSEKLFSLFKDSKLCPHLHFPFQYGDDRILTEMNKKETVARYEDMVLKARRINPGMAISCDIMVGFPSEDEKSFQNTVEFLNRIKPMRMHIFSFSAREKTPLFKTRMKNHWVTYQRYNFLRKLAQDFSLQYIKRFLGKRLYMIAEEKKNGLISGYTENYIKVFLKGKVLLGEIVPVRIEKVEPTSIFARLD